MQKASTVVPDDVIITWTAQKPLGPSQRSHSSAMLLHFQLKSWTMTVLSPWQIGVLNCANAPVEHAQLCRWKLELLLHSQN